MQYRPFGKDNWKISSLGFGAMRLPILLGDKEVDEREGLMKDEFLGHNFAKFVIILYRYK